MINGGIKDKAKAMAKDKAKAKDKGELVECCSSRAQPGLIDLSGAPFTMHEFFAGVGLAAYGLKDLFSPVWANDNCPRKYQCYAANYLSDHFVLDDIAHIDGSSLPFAHLSWASFPCQDLSLAGNTKGINASRSGLVWEFLRIFDHMPFKPKILVLENVVGLLTSNHGQNYLTLHQALVERGFKVGAIILDAKHFVPQSRERVFIIAVPQNFTIPEGLSTNKPNCLHNCAASKLGERLSNGEGLRNGDGSSNRASSRNWVYWSMPKPLERTTNLQDIIEPDLPFDKDHVLKLIPNKHLDKLAASSDAGLTKQTYDDTKHLKDHSEHLKDGTQLINNDVHQPSKDNHIIYATAFRRTRKGEQHLELRTDGIAGCLRTPKGGSSKQYVIAKVGDELHARLLSVRESARLMGVPDSFKLPGSNNDG